MSSRVKFALTGVIVAFAISPSLAQQVTGELLPAPTAPDPAVQQTAPVLSETTGSLAVGAPPVAPATGNDGWGGKTIAAPIQRAPLGAPTPETTPDRTDPAAASSLERHLDVVQDVLTDQEDVRPNMVERGENLEWGQMDGAIGDGDFAEANSAEEQIGWVAKGKQSNAPKLRRPRVDLKGMTRLKLNESGSTVLDITKGRVVTKF